jgi:FixJ family two-component response regulator
MLTTGNDLAPWYRAPDVAGKVAASGAVMWEFHGLSKAAYIITEDKQLGTDLRRMIEVSGIHVKWFASPSEYSTYERPTAASCLLVSAGIVHQCELGIAAPPVIVLSERADIPACVRAMRDGAHDFLNAASQDSRFTGRAERRVPEG